MGRKILALLLAAVLCLSLVGCVSGTPGADETQTLMTTQPTEATQPTETAQVTTVPAETEPKESTEPAAEGITPLLYKVTDSDGDSVWLFGAVHLGLESFYPLPDYVMEAYRGSDALAVEVDIVAFEKDIRGQVQAIRSLMYTDGTQISDRISKLLYEDTVEILEENDMYNRTMDNYLPAMWFMLVDNASLLRMELDPELGIDRHFLTQAKKDGKEIREIESADFQYTMLGEFSEELQIMLLKSAVISYHAPMMAKAQMEQMLKYWSTGDEEGLGMQFGTQQTGGTSLEEMLLLEEYNTAMYTDRNDAMTEYAVDALEAGEELFICVGAAHIVGEGAMAEQLRDRGFTVEIIS